MGTVRIIGGRSGRVWPLVLQAVRESRQAGRGTVLYVPEQYTLQAERDLITGLELPGLLEIRVVSPRKLRMLVRERAGSGTRPLLSEAGRAMAIHRTMTEKAEELAYYRNMADLPGAVQRVGEALDELRESDVTAEELAGCAGSAETGAESAKLKDLGIIRSGYEQLITEQFDDEKTVWTDTVNRLAGSGLWQGADLAVYGFDSIRPDLRELLAGVCGQVNSASVFLTMDAETAPDGRIFTQQHLSVRQLAQALEEAGCGTERVWPGTEREDCAPPLAWLDRYLFAGETQPWQGDAGSALTLYAAATPWDEAERISAALRQWRKEGIPWHRMAVAVPSGGEAASILRANLRINGIPFVCQQKDSATDHPLCRMLTAALSCLGEGYRTDDVITAARSGYTTLTEAEGLALEEYAAAHGIEGRRWEKPFTAGDGAAEAERIRVKFITPVEELRTKLKKARTAQASAEALAAFLDAEEAGLRLQEQEEALLANGMYREAVVNRQMLQTVTEILEQLRVLLGSRRARIGDLKQMLLNALATVSVASLPEQENGVVIGEVGHLLSGEVDALALPRLQDGALTAPESGWLTDTERRRMEEATGKTIGISRELGCLIREYDFYRTMTLPRKHLLVSWCLKSEDGGVMQPDSLAGRLKELFPGVREEGGVTDAGRQAKPVTPLAALDGLGPMLSDLKNGRAEDLTESWKTALVSLLHHGVYAETARRMLEELLPAEEKRLNRDTARRLFSLDRLSVSRLEAFAGCPYRHFIDYGLRPVQRESFEFADNDAGDFFHEALDRFMKQAGETEGWPGLPEEQADGIMDAVLAELTEQWTDSPLRADALGEWQGGEYLRRVRRAARVLTRFAANSEFRTIGTEQAFGEPDGLPPVMIPLKDGSQAAIRGKIDRIDTYENGEGVWLRVVDNKSREKKPDPARMATGEQLQLMIYLKAAAAAVPGARLAGALYFPVEDREVATASDNPADIEAERMAAARMKGLVTAREDVVRAMDRDIAPYSVDQVFNQDGSVRKGARWAVEEETLRVLTEAAADLAGELCDRMRDGEIAAAPREDNSGSPCRWCGYRSICRAGRDSGRPRDPETTYRAIAEAAAGKKLRENEKQGIMTEEKNP